MSCDLKFYSNLKNVPTFPEIGLYIMRASIGCFLRLDYLSAKMSRADDAGKEELKKQMDLIEKEIGEIR